MPPKKKKIVDPEFEKMVEERGYTRIPRQVLLVYTWIARYLRRYDAAVFQAIICSTWGWSKMEGWVATERIVNVTGINRHHVYRSIQKLILYRMISRRTDKNGKVIYRINHDVMQWRVESRGGCIDLSRMVMRKLWPSKAEEAQYKQFDACNEAEEFIEESNPTEVDAESNYVPCD